MPSIDERVVAMSFENAVFETRVATTMATLSKLDVAIKNIGSTSGLQNIENAANKVTLNGPMSALDKLKAKLGGAGHGASQGFSDIESASNKVTLEGPSRAADKLQGKMGQLSAGSTFSDIEKASEKVELSGLTRALDNVTSKFSVLEGAASVAIGNIASKAAQKGAAFGKSFAFGPVQDGFKEYGTNLGSIQTILANTEGQQVSGLDAVKSHLGELNEYSDKTIYSFSEMAKNIGTFTAAGVQLPQATKSIKGIANLAALSGSNSQQASTAMYQLSQAISSGRVGLQDWNSVVNAGMGGAVFQKSLMRTAENMGAVEKGAIKIDKTTGKATVNGKSFRESIMAKPGEQSWLTSDVLTATLGQLTGDMTDAELAAKGFTKEQIKAIQAQAKNAQDAATQVKTLPQVFDVARETIGSGWAKTFELIFGDFEQSKKTFTAMSNFINGWINKVSDARNKLLGEWSKLGGRGELIAGIKQLFEDLGRLIQPIKAAFEDMFPPKTGKDLFDLTKGFHELMENLRPSPEVVGAIYHIFRAFFAILDIGWNLIKGVAGVIADLLGVVGSGQGGFVNLTKAISHFIVAIHDALVDGGLLKGFFEGLSGVLKAPVSLVVRLAKAFAGLFGSGENTSNLVQQRSELIRFGKVLSPIERIVLNVKNAWGKLTEKFGEFKQMMEPWFSQMVQKLKGFGDILGNAFQNIDFDKIMSVVQTGLIAGLLVTLRKAMGDSGVIGKVKDSLDGLTKVFGGLTGNLESMQKKVQAQTILTIAGAVVALAAGVYILSTIDGGKLAKAMTAVAIGLGELMGAMKLMMAGMGKLGVLQLPVIAAGMIGMAIAVTILAAAMKIFSTMSWEDIAKGMVGIGGALGSIALGMSLMPPTLPLTAAGLILIGVALNLIAAAIGQFGEMSWDEIGRGLLGVVEALGGIALGVSMMPPNLALTAAGLILMGIALSFIGGAIQKMGELRFDVLLKGLGAIMFALLAIAEAMWLMPPNMIATAAGLVLVGVALSSIGAAIAIIGNLDVATILKGLIGIGGALVVLAIGLILMEGTLPGALALLAAAAALAILGPAIALIGNLKFSTLLKGLLGIAAALGVLALVGLVASAPLVSLGVALLPLAGVFLITAGAVFLFAKAMQMLGAEGGKGFAVVLAAITAFVAMIPSIIISFLKGLLDVIKTIKDLLPQVVVALGVIIDTIIAFVIASAPKLAMAIGILVDSIVQVLLENSPKLIAMGVQMLGNLLNGISQNIAQVTTKVGEIIVKFLDAFTAQIPKIQESGAKLIIEWMKGLARYIPKIVEQAGNIITKFLEGVAKQIPRVVGTAQKIPLAFLRAILGLVPKLVALGTEIILKFMDGVQEAIPKLVKKGLAVARAFLNGIADGMVGLADAGFDAVIKFLNGIAETIRENDKELVDAGANILDALVDGISEAAGRAGGLIKRAITGLFGMLPGWAKKILGIHSPSKIFMDIGHNVAEGFAKGVASTKAHKVVKDASIGPSTGLFSGMINNLRSFLKIHSPSEVMAEIGQQVNQGFAKGLRGSQSDIRNAFKELNSKLASAMKDARTAIRENQKTLDEERAKANPDAEAIKAAEAAIAKNQAILRKSKDAHFGLTTSLIAVKKELLGLAKNYDTVTKKLEAAKQEVTRLKQEQESFQKSLVDKYTAPPDVSSLVSEAMADAELTYTERAEKARKAAEEAEKRRRIDQVALYKKALGEQLIATVAYNATLKKLRELGLDDATYKKLVEQGTAGSEFANQLLAGGKTAVDAINALDSQILAESTDLANSASSAMYKVGIQAAKDFVAGLKADQKALKEEMDIIADKLVRAIKNRLKMKSPSQVFIEMGQNVVEGLAQGLESSSKRVGDAASELGANAISAVQNTIAAISTAVSDNIDVDPVITPVLDLSSVEKDAGKLGDLTNVTPISAAASFGQASALSKEVSAAQQVASEASAAGTPTFMFEQNNYSPEALSDVDIYRQTKNQLGQIKNALGVS